MNSSALSQPYVDGLAAGEVRYQRCQQCGAAQRLARYACTRCGSPRLSWQASAARGKVFSVSVVNRAPSDDFRALVPYALALVDLQEGARVMGHAPVGTAIGDPVTVEVFGLGERRLLRFVSSEPRGEPS